MADYNAQPARIDGCSDAIQCLIHETCMVSKFTPQKLTYCIDKLHDDFLRGFRKLENHIWKEVTGIDVRNTSFTLARHKLFFNYMFYHILTLPGTTELATKVDRVKEKHHWIMRRMKKGKWEEITNRQWALLKPHLSTYPQQRVIKSLKITLRDIEMNPTNFVEERDSQLVHNLLERYAPHHSPYNLLFLLDDADVQLLGKFVESMKTVKSLASIKAEVGHLPKRYKKCLKLILLLSNRYNEFGVSYADTNPLHLKCMECVPDNFKTDSTFVMCEYCREMLVYKDMRKRPASFGCYLQTERMEKRCYRDDSDKLRCIYCFDKNNYISLIFSHPDRNEVGLCQGRRACFKSVGFLDRKCTKCAMILEDWQFHKDTCLAKKKDNPCYTCKIVLAALDGNFPKTEEEHIEEDGEGKKQIESKQERKRPALLRLMDYAKARKERRKLIK